MADREGTPPPSPTLSPPPLPPLDVEMTRATTRSGSHKEGKSKSDDDDDAAAGSVPKKDAPAAGKKKKDPEKVSDEGGSKSEPESNDDEYVHSEEEDDDDGSGAVTITIPEKGTGKGTKRKRGSDSGKDNDEMPFWRRKRGRASGAGSARRKKGQEPSAPQGQNHLSQLLESMDQSGIDEAISQYLFWRYCADLSLNVGKNLRGKGSSGGGAPVDGSASPASSASEKYSSVLKTLLKEFPNLSEPRANRPLHPPPVLFHRWVAEPQLQEEVVRLRSQVLALTKRVHEMETTAFAKPFTDDAIDAHELEKALSLKASNMNVERIDPNELESALSTYRYSAGAAATANPGAIAAGAASDASDDDAEHESASDRRASAEKPPPPTRFKMSHRTDIPNDVKDRIHEMRSTARTKDRRIQRLASAVEELRKQLDSANKWVPAEERTNARARRVNEPRVSFEERVRQLEEHIKKTGSCKVRQLQSDEGKDSAFIDWVRRMRRITMEAAEDESILDRPGAFLDRERFETLKSLGMLEWNYEKKARSWESHFEDLLEFRARYGHVNPPRRCTEFNNVGKWVQHQRINKKRTKQEKPYQYFTQEQIDLLESVGFQWEVKDTITWKGRIEECILFKRVNGHLNVPPVTAEDKEQLNKRELSFRTWCGRMRSEYVKVKNGGKGRGSFDEGRIKELERLGFIF